MNHKGHIMIMTIMVTAIAVLWLSGVLVVSSNHYKINEDRLAQQQVQLLAQSGLAEGQFRLQKALLDNNLGSMPQQIVQRNVQQNHQVGTISATWRQKGNNIVLSSFGKVGQAKASAQATYVKLGQYWYPDDHNDLATTVVWSEENYGQTIQRQPNRNYILLSDPLNQVTLKSVVPIDGGLLIGQQVAGPTNKLNVVVNYPLTVAEQLLVQGNLVVENDLTAKDIIVHGNVQVTAGVIQCERLLIYGDLTLQQAQQLQGTLYLSGQLLNEQQLVEQGLSFVKSEGQLPALTQRMILVDMTL